jgi:L-asparaginase II
LANPVLVEITRGDLVESIHRGSITIADADGRIAFSLGDIDSPVYPRSSLKPIQALPLLESSASAAPWTISPAARIPYAMSRYGKRW